MKNSSEKANQQLSGWELPCMAGMAICLCLCISYRVKVRLARSLESTRERERERITYINSIVSWV